MFKYLKRFNEAIELKEKKNKSKKERSPYYILTYHYMIGDSNGYTKKKVEVSADNPFLERFCKILNSLKPNSKSWGVMLTEKDIESFLDEGQITKDEYLFLMRTLFIDDEDGNDDDKEWINYFKTDEENEFANEFYEGVESYTEYSFLVFEGVKLKYVDEHGQKNMKKHFLSDIKITENNQELYNSIIEKLIYGLKSELIKEELLNYISYEIINEEFSPKNILNKVSDKAKNILINILHKANGIMSFINRISDGIRELFIQLITSAKTFLLEQLKLGALKAKLEELKDHKKEGLIKEVKLLKEVLNFYRKDFLKNFKNKSDKNLTSVLEPISESILNESSNENVVNTIIGKIESIPPFSFLHKIASASEKGANLIIQSISELTESLGGPSFQLPVIALLVGLCIEYMVKSSTGHWLLELVGTSPIGMVVKGIKITATFIALVSALDSTLGTNFIGHEHHIEVAPIENNIENV